MRKGQRVVGVKRARKLEVLRAIVSQYVQTNEPVSSKAVAQAKSLGVSSATIRNDMGELEEEGLITQPHVSAGRIPTQAGYRFYVDCLPTPEPLTKPQTESLRRTLGESDDVEAAVLNTVRFLSGLTRQTAVLEYPSLSPARIRRVELVDLDFSRLLIIVVTSSGEVTERLVEIPEGTTTDDGSLRALRNALNERLTDEPVGKVEEALRDLVEDQDPGSLARPVAEAITVSVRPTATRKIVTAGTSHLARAGIEFSDVAQVLDVLEDQALLLRVLTEVHTEPIQVSIGQENRHQPLSETSLVSARYLDPNRVGTHLGVIGPTRMDYSQALSAVEAVSRYLGRLLVEQFGFEGEATPPITFDREAPRTGADDLHVGVDEDESESRTT